MTKRISCLAASVAMLLVNPFVPSAAASSHSVILCAFAAAREGETGNPITNLESKIGRTFKAHRQYENWDGTFPNRSYDADVAAGRIPFSVWNGQTKTGTQILWKDIVAGQHDALIRSRARAIKDWGKLMYLGFHNEPERRTENGTAAEYAAAYRHIHGIFKSEGVTNVGWVAGPLMSFTFAGYNGGAAAWYPGDAYVDFVGVNGYNWYPGQPSKPWRSFREVFEKPYAFSVAHNRPLVIYEHGVMEDTATPDPQRKAQWFRDALATVKTWPLLHAACYFHTGPPNKPYPWWIDSTSQSLTAYKELAHDPIFGGSAVAPPPPPPEPAEYDLSVVMVDEPDPATTGQNLTYKITVTNAGTSTNDAPGVTVTDALPSSVSLASASSSQGSGCTGTTTVTCALGTIPKGGSATVTIVVTPNTAGTISNSATVSGSGKDTAPGDDSASQSTDVHQGSAPTTTIQVTNYAFTPTPANVPMGGIAKWEFQSAHTATDRLGTNLFDSGTRNAGESYSFQFPWAGRYGYKCSIHASSTSTAHRGIIAVPVTATPEKGGPGTVFTVTWATAAPRVGFVFDVQVKKPNATGFVAWKAGVTATSATYNATAGTGGYRFRARIRNASTGKASMWSPEDYFSLTK